MVNKVFVEFLGYVYIFLKKLNVLIKKIKEY